MAVEEVKFSPAVYIVGGGMMYIRMFYERGFTGAKGVEDADIVCFTGGEDVDPSLYGERALSTTHFNVDRDKREVDIFGEAFLKSIPMVGICRGAQFLNVMSDGKLWQHVNNHGRTHSIRDVMYDKVIPGMTSTHHQQMIPGKGATVLAVASLSTQKLSFGKEIDRSEPVEDDVEAVWYDDSKCLCFQPHPEYDPNTAKYFFELFDTYIFEPMKKGAK